MENLHNHADKGKKKQRYFLNRTYYPLNQKLTVIILQRINGERYFSFSQVALTFAFLMATFIT
jgi:hypothetical protein